MNFLKNLFHKLPPPSSPPPPSLSLDQLKQFDDIWVKINDNIYEGWIVDRVRDQVTVLYTNNEAQLIETNFTIERPYNRETLTQGHKTLFLTKKAAGLQ